MKATSISTLNKEIEVVEVIIRQLQQCLAIYHIERKYKDFKATVIDLQKCKRELNRLKNELDIQQGETVNDAETKPHRKNVL
jgi:hypothetical protein